MLPPVSGTGKRIRALIDFSSHAWQVQQLKIFLVGFMGAGKTTLGRLLAARLGWPFHDVDTAVEESEGASVLRIFRERGEPYFRGAEIRALQALAAEPGPAVIACGGGTFCDAGNQEVMRAHGLSVWVDTPFETIWARREALARERPLAGSESGMRALYTRRLPFYRMAAIRVAAVGKPADLLADDVMMLLRRSQIDDRTEQRRL